jgi:hypothetical protein
MPVFHAIRKANLALQEKDREDVYISVDRLFYKRRMFTVNNIHMIESPYKPEELAQKEIDGTLYFYSAGSPMSNHFSCNFVVDGIAFNCLEQFMMAKKSKMADDRDAYNRIMGSDDPVEQMRIAKNMTTLDEGDWERRCFELMRPGVYAKFAQNTFLKNKLLSTRSLVLAEASGSDLWWGIGIKLDDSDLGKKRWRGQNRLGDLLMETRDELKKM